MSSIVYAAYTTTAEGSKLLSEENVQEVLLPKENLCLGKREVKLKDTEEQTTP